MDLYRYKGTNNLYTITGSIYSIKIEGIWYRNIIQYQQVINGELHFIKYARQEDDFHKSFERV